MHQGPGRSTLGAGRFPVMGQTIQKESFYPFSLAKRKRFLPINGQSIEESTQSNPSNLLGNCCLFHGKRLPLGCRPDGGILEFYVPWPRPFSTRGSDARAIRFVALVCKGNTTLVC